ncbi:MAG: hypothetical protein IVW51_11150 [Thermaceae bacterium]|nr:hypothetical protein [Thermaceae bacterium]
MLSFGTYWNLFKAGQNKNAQQKKPIALPTIKFLPGTVEPTPGLHIIKIYAPSQFWATVLKRVARLSGTWDAFVAFQARTWAGPNGLRVRFPRSAEIVNNGKKEYMPRKGFDTAGNYFYFYVEFY